MSIDYCCKCGAETEIKIPEGDNKPRAVCTFTDSCGHIHYQNPLVVVECIPECDGQILLCKRDISPRRGFWTIPGGFMEKGESLEECAIRETREEAGATVEITGLQGIYSTTFNDQVHVVFRGRMVNRAFHAGDETQTVKLFSWADIPWDDLAFEVTKEALTIYSPIPPRFDNSCKTITEPYVRNKK